MLSNVSSLGLMGIDGYKVDVQVDLSKGLPAFDTVGLPGQAVKESKERVRAAMKNIGIPLPAMRITCNLAPADTKKEGPIYDLPIAVGILNAIGEISKVDEFAFIGELALDGRLTEVHGILPMVIAAKKLGIEKIVLPTGNANEASFVEGIMIFAAESLKQVIDFLNGESKIEPVKQTSFDTIKKAKLNMWILLKLKGRLQLSGRLKLRQQADIIFCLLVHPEVERPCLHAACLQFCRR